MKILLAHKENENTRGGATGYINADNFEEVANEIKRWFTRPNTICMVLSVAKVNDLQPSDSDTKNRQAKAP